MYRLLCYYYHPDVLFRPEVIFRQTGCVYPALTLQIQIFLILLSALLWLSLLYHPVLRFWMHNIAVQMLLNVLDAYLFHTPADNILVRTVEDEIDGDHLPDNLSHYFQSLTSL